MSRLPVVGGDGNAWGTILNDYLGVTLNADGTQKTLMMTQPAESVAIPLFKAQPFTAGVAPFELAISSTPFAGVYDQVAFVGWNAEVNLVGGSSVPGQPGWLLGFEYNYFNSPNTATEFYLQYTSPDHTSIVGLRPLMIDCYRNDNTTGAVSTTFDIGNNVPAGLSFFQVYAAGIRLQNLTPTLYELDVGTVHYYKNTSFQVQDASNNSQFYINAAGGPTYQLGNAAQMATIAIYLFGATYIYNNGPLNFMRSSDSTPSWYINIASNGTQMYYRDIVNSRQHMTFTGGATPTAANTELNSKLKIDGLPAFVAGDHYLVCDAAGNVHVSAVGPAS